MPGIVGVQMAQGARLRGALPRGSALVMHTDGLSDGGSPPTSPGCSPRTRVVATQILNQAEVRRDDAGFVVARTGND
ncbi:hypothetical protein GCM10023238_07200 [Streptomyces heliomycini]